MATIQTITLPGRDAKSRPQKRYRVLIRRVGLKPISRTFKKKKEALEWATGMEADRDKLENYPDQEARRRTLAEAIDRYMDDFQGKDRSVLSRLGWWRDHYGAYRLHYLTRAEIKEALRKLSASNAQRNQGRKAKGTIDLGRPRSAGTINRYHQALQGLLSWCVDEGWLTKNPAKEIKRKTEPKGRKRFLSDVERERLLEACKSSEWRGLYPLVLLALSTGARLGELLSLTWDKVDLERGTALLEDTKNEDDRILPLVSKVRDELEKYRKVRSLSGARLFYSPAHPAKPIPDATFRTYWDAALRAAEINDFRFHDLRHSCASYLAMSGASLIEIADVLGHRTLAMVQRYAHLTHQHRAELLERTTGTKV
jgi:integrase